MKKIIFDVECLPNCFIANLLNVDTRNKVTLEISERKNDTDKFVKIFNKNDRVFITYNGIDYDGVLINFILMNSNLFWEKLVAELKRISDEIINEKKYFFKYRHDNFFNQIDLLRMLFSKELRVGLKEMQVSMFYPNVLEMNLDWNKPIAVDKIDDLIYYCWNDVDSTEWIYMRSLDALSLRQDIEKEFGLNCYSQDGMTLGVNILAKEYCDETGLTLADLKEFGTPRESMDLKDIILPWIEFSTPELQTFLNDLKTKTIVNTKGDLAFEVEFDGMKYGIGTGGIHSRNKPTIYITNDEYDLVDGDVDLTQWVN